jgi:DNA repair exonuclease SbcCD nuclease subunit
MKFIHTADWQLGLKLRYVDSERAAQLRLMRFHTVRKIAKVAVECRAEFVLVAGDVFDDNGVGRDTLQWAHDVLKLFGDIPVVLLPGNHDAATEDSALSRLTALPNVRTALSREVIEFPSARIYPCPLMRRHESDDPTAWLPQREGGDGIRIALAHGGVINFAQDAETPNLINAEAIVAKGFDYVALGDWHGTLRYSDRVWYSGAHEATRFKEADPGNILLVEIAHSGAIPEVTKIPVHEASWHTWDIELTDDAQVEELRARIEALPGIAATLLQLNLSGNLSLAARENLDRIILEFSDRLAHLRGDPGAVQSAPTTVDLERLSGEGFVAEALTRLREGSDTKSTEAIRLLYRLQQEAEHAVA